MKVAYLSNQYPKISHTFIRREIAGVEQAGLEVVRYAVRSAAENLVDERDREERGRTRVLLGRGLAGLLPAVLATLATRPLRSLRAGATALAICRRSPRSWLHHLAYLAEACQLLRWTSRAGVEHVHVHFATNPTDVALLCHELGGPPFSFTAHGPSDLGSAWADTLPTKIRRAVFAVAVCQDGKRRLLALAPPGHEGKIQVVGCGVDSRFLGAEVPGVPEQPRLVCVARCNPEKGLPVLLRAARLLADEGLDFQLRLIGDGPERRALESLAAELGLDGRVRFEGWRSGDEIRAAIVESRAMVLSSFSEGLPVVLMEALALRRPVVGTDVGGISELVLPGRSGWVVPAGDPRALAGAMRAVLSRPAPELDAMGRFGAQQVAEAHDSAAQARRIAGLLLGSRGGDAGAGRA